MTALAEALRGMQKVDEAESLFLGALKTLEAAEVGEVVEVADCLVGLAAIDRGRGKFDEGEAKLVRALAIRERRGKTHPDVARCLGELGDLERAPGQARGGGVTLSRGVGRLGAGRGSPDHPDFAELLSSYAELLRRLGRTDEADRMSARSRSILDKRAPEPAPR